MNRGSKDCAKRVGYTILGPVDAEESGFVLETEHHRQGCEREFTRIRIAGSLSFSIALGA